MTVHLDECRIAGEVDARLLLLYLFLLVNLPCKCAEHGRAAVGSPNDELAELADAVAAQSLRAQIETCLFQRQAQVGVIDDSRVTNDLVIDQRDVMPGARQKVPFIPFGPRFATFI